MKWAPVVLLCVIAGVPVAAGLASGLAVGFSGRGWQELLSTPGLVRSLGLSVWTGTAATAIAVMLAHLTLALAWTKGWSGRLRALSLPLLASPHLALAIGVVLLLSPSGLLLRMLSPWATGLVQPPDWATVQDSLGIALICGLVIKETPFVILVLLGALAQVNAERLMLQSNALGYGRLKGWLVAVAPVLHRQGRLAIAAVLIFGVTNVEMALPLGPSAPPTLSILLLRWFTAPDLVWRPQAFAGIWLLLMTTIGCLTAVYGSTALAKRLWRHWATSGARALHDSLLSWLVAASAAVALGSGLFAVAALLLRTVGGAWRFPRVVPNPVSLDAWRSVAPDLGASWLRRSMGLRGLGGRDPATLSGGQRARVGLLGVLLSRPRALLLDEPFGHLDPRTRGDVRQLVFNEVRRRSLPTLLVTHDAEDVAAAGGACLELKPGNRGEECSTRAYSR